MSDLNNQIYNWTDYYDITSPGLDHDVEFFTEKARESGGTVLDLACGTGRITIPLAREGIRVIGIDASEQMIAKAKEKVKTMGLDKMVRLELGDMRTFDLKEEFDLIIIPYRSFLHLLTIQDQVAALGRIRKHLKADGKFIFNVFVPAIKDLYEENEKMSSRGIYEIPGTKEKLVVWDYTRYDYFLQMAEIIRTYERISEESVVIEKIVCPFYIRYIFPAELHHLLRITGFKVHKRYGTFSKEPFTEKSKELIIEAVKM